MGFNEECKESRRNRQGTSYYGSGPKSSRPLIVFSDGGSDRFHTKNARAPAGITPIGPPLGTPFALFLIAESPIPKARHHDTIGVDGSSKSRFSRSRVSPLYPFLCCAPRRRPYASEQAPRRASAWRGPTRCSRPPPSRFPRRRSCPPPVFRSWRLRRLDPQPHRPWRSRRKASRHRRHRPASRQSRSDAHPPTAPRWSAG